MTPKPFTKHGQILHGADYYPEQWPRDIWPLDMDLMNQASVNGATIGVFAWSMLEPEEGRYTFDWLDDVMDMLERSGRLAVLATPSAAMPAWMSGKYPEILRTGSDRIRRRHGNRVNYCWTSPIYRQKVASMSEMLAKRYAGHPALALWHVSNEYGGECYCPLCVDAFRKWLNNKFNGDLDALNHAYWTTFWSHRYTDWSQIDAPGGLHGEASIHGLDLDWKRYTSDQIIDFFRQEAEPLRKHTPDVPITTNMMGTYSGIDYWKLAPHVDVVSWDSYPGFTDGPVSTRDFVRIAFTHDLYRTLKRKPFALIECTPSSSNWYRVMHLKRPGMHQLEGLQAIAHGSDSVMYFQWRQSRGSQEKFHGAVVQHDGLPTARVFQEVADLGKKLSSLGSVIGTHTCSDVAIIYDWENGWAIDGSCGPKLQEMRYGECVFDYYRPLWEMGIPTDIIDSEQDFARYRLVIAPMLYMLKPGVSARIREFVSRGGIFVSTYWTGIVDENDLAILGGWPGGLTDVFGIHSEEIDPLFDFQRVAIQVTEKNSLGMSGIYEAQGFCQIVQSLGAEVLANYGGEFYAGSPALTRNPYGEGEAYFVASRNDAAFNSHLLGLLAKRADLKRVLDAEMPEGVTAQIRTGETRDVIFVMNCNPEPRTVTIRPSETLSGMDGDMIPETFVLEGFGVRVFQREKATLPSREVRVSAE